MYSDGAVVLGAFVALLRKLRKEQFFSLQSNIEISESEKNPLPEG